MRQCSRLHAQAMPGEDASGLAWPEDVAGRIASLCLPGSDEHGALIGRD